MAFTSTMYLRITCLFAGLLGLSGPTLAASSTPIETPGGTVRLVTSGLSDDEGRLRGALEIRLEPGWKTYWRDPGPTGIPPQIELVGRELEGIEILFPAPKSFEDPYGDWAGYDRSVTLPVIFHTPAPGTAPLIEAEVLLGICKVVCIPVEAPLVFDATAGADDQRDALTVQAAFAALPDAERPDFRLAGAEMRDGMLVLHADLPEGNAPAELFITALDGRITLPVLSERKESAATFTAKVLTHPDPGAELHYTLVQDDRAVSGRLPFPHQTASARDHE